MNENCPNCLNPLGTGDRVFQLARGRYYVPFETPSYAYGPSVLLEVHEECCQNFPIDMQRQPYKCRECDDRLQHGEDVVYGVLGDKPSPQYTRPESRGH